MRVDGRRGARSRVRHQIFDVCVGHGQYLDELRSTVVRGSHHAVSGDGAGGQVRQRNFFELKVGAVSGKRKGFPKGSIPLLNQG